MNAKIHSAGVRFHVLGQLEIVSNGKPVELGPPRQRALLAVLLINAGKVVSLPTIIKSIWGADPPRQAMGTLQAYVSRLRKVLRNHIHPVSLVHRHHGYMLEAEALLVDAAVFEALVKEGREALKAGDLEVARSHASDALKLWQGTPMGELYEYEFAVLEADRLEQVRLRALETWADACLGTGSYEDVTARLGEELRSSPTSERLGGKLMVAQYHSGQPTEALLSYQRMRAAIADELGVDPSSELQTLHGQILRQELVAATVPGRSRPASSPPPTAPAPQPTRAAPHAPQRCRLVGREAEMARVRTLFKIACEGNGQVLFVLGDQGIGKTELLHEMERRLSTSKIQVVRACCVAAPATVLYFPWEQVVRQLTDASTTDEPALDDRPHWTPVRHFTHQKRICQAVLSAAQHTPVLVLLEDLHLADVRVLEVLHLLTKQISHTKVMVLATVREHERPRGEGLSIRRALGRILQEGNADALRLRELTVGQTQELIASVTGTVPEPDRVRHLRHAAGGNPFLLLSMATAEADGEVRDEPSIPFAVREVLLERLRAFPPKAVDVLSLCAVIGTVVQRTVVEYVLDERQLPRTLVDEALNTGLLHADPADEDLLRFTHGLVRDLLLEDASPFTRAERHRDVAKVLARKFRPGDDTAETRRHFLAASRVLGAREGLRPLLLMADRAQGRFCHSEALHQMEDTAAVLAELPWDESISAVELDVHKRLLWLYGLLEGYGSPHIEQVFVRARKLERTVDGTQPTGLLQTRAIMAIASGRYTAAAQTAGLLYELAEHGGGPLARSAACYADGVTLHVSGRLDEALAPLNQGARIIENLVADHHPMSQRSPILTDQLIDFLAYLALTYWLMGDRAKAQHYRFELLRLTKSDRYDRPWDRAFARYVDAVIAVAEGDVERASLAARAGLDLATRCQLTYWRHMLSVPLGWAEVHQGMPETGLSRIRKEIDAAANNRTVLRRTLHLGLLADALRHVGAVDEAHQTIVQAVQEIEERGEYVYFCDRWPFASMLHGARPSGAFGAAKA